MARLLVERVDRSKARAAAAERSGSAPGSIRPARAVLTSSARDFMRSEVGAVTTPRRVFMHQLRCRLGTCEHPNSACPSRTGLEAGPSARATEP